LHALRNHEGRARGALADAQDRSIRCRREARRAQLHCFAPGLNAPIKTIGRHTVPLGLHPEIETSITVIVARNNDEAERIARGENVTQLREDQTEAEAATVAAEAFFEPEAAAAVREGEGEGGEPAENPAPAAKS
jgi:hypothetical protein